MNYKCKLICIVYLYVFENICDSAWANEVDVSESYFELG